MLFIQYKENKHTYIVVFQETIEHSLGSDFILRCKNTITVMPWKQAIHRTNCNGYLTVEKHSALQLYSIICSNFVFDNNLHYCALNTMYSVCYAIYRNFGCMCECMYACVGYRHTAYVHPYMCALAVVCVHV